jgi:hypothetical protein
MNCTQQDLQIEQTGDIIQILFMAFTVIPLIASEILPFLPCDPNGLVHAIVLALSKMKYKERPRASIDAHPRP